jgi:hypothetical protein
MKTPVRAEWAALIRRYPEAFETGEWAKWEALIGRYPTTDSRGEKSKTRY